VPKETGRKVVAQNRRARHDYSIIDVYEAGLVLTGTEVKSLRLGRAALTDAFAQIDDDEAWLVGLHIPEYTQGTWTNHAPRRKRKLLLHRDEIAKLVGKTRDGGLTIIPLALYFKDGKAKVEIALAKGKKAYDRRQDLATRDASREMERALGRHRKGMER
jgi:SsrA-binding protein